MNVFNTISLPLGAYFIGMFIIKNKEGFGEWYLPLTVVTPVLISIVGIVFYIRWSDENIKEEIKKEQGVKA